VRGRRFLIFQQKKNFPENNFEKVFPDIFVAEKFCGSAGNVLEKFPEKSRKIFRLAKNFSIFAKNTLNELDKKIWSDPALNVLVPYRF
jgi:hypothetical protein